jgi:F-type H+-transporting ATPase subunit b
MHDTLIRLGIDWRELLAQAICFGIIVFVLAKYAYGPVLAVLQQRRDKIAEGINNADKIKAELARTEALQREVLEKANTQATKLIEEARAAAARVQEQETQKAIAQAEQIITKARESAELERQRMLAEVKREVVTLVVHTTGLVAGKVLSAEDQQSLAEETRRQLAA